jgi:uncharacterized coiled-coil protein SlyX
MAYVQYKRTFMELSPKANEHFNELNQFNQQIRSLLNRLQEADNTAKRQFDNV